MSRMALLAGSALGILFATPVLAAPGAPADQCDTESIQAMSLAGTTVGFAAREPGGCRIGGYVTTQNPGPNRVLFTLFLPSNFNGRYLYIGVGGSAGSLPSVPAVLTGQGYAIAGSDGGTGAKTMADYSFYKNPAKALDFSYRGVQVSAAATQAITKAYFSGRTFHRYISGCSGGGAMAMMNARRFGSDQFDGFLIGATGWPGDSYMSHVYAIERRLQNHPDAWISPQLLEKAQAAIIQRYDRVDGVTDGIIADQRSLGKFDTTVLRDVGFTAPQVEMFEFISQPHAYSGPGLHGKVVFPGFPITNVRSWSAFLLGGTPPPWRASNKPPIAGAAIERPPYAHLMADTNTRAIQADLDYWSVNEDSRLVGLATDFGKKIPFDDPMDFSSFAKSGAKMIIYHGVDDPNISYLGSLSAYDTLIERFPDARLRIAAVMIPGLGHCRGGLGPTAPDDELLASLVSWVESGIAPEAIPSTREAPGKSVERTFLLCAEPKRSRLKQPDLDPKAAASWTCS